MKKKISFFTALFALISASGITSFAAGLPAVSNDSEVFFAFIKQCTPVIVVAVLSVVLILLAIVFRKKLAKLLNDSSSSMMINAFMLFFAVFGIACYAMAVATDGETWQHILNGTEAGLGRYSHFADYLKTLQYAGSKNFHLSAEKFSPFSLLIFYILAQFMPPSLIHSDSYAKYLLILRNQTFIYLYLILVLFCIFLIYTMSRAKLRQNGIKFRNEIVAFLLVVSYPTMYCISMGNIAGFAVALCLFFLQFYNSEKKIFRELSIVAIAVSAAIVPYTFAFALLLLTDKTKIAKLDFAQATVIFSVLFVLPSIFTGFVNMTTYLKTLFAVPELCVPGNGSLANFLNFAGVNDIVIYILTAVTEIIALACLFILPTAWQKSAAAIYFILNISPSINGLTMIFVFIPLVYLLSEKSHKAIDWLYLLAFALLVTPFPEWFYSCLNEFTIALETIGILNLRNANEIAAPVATQMIFVLIVCQSVSLLIKNKKKKAEVQTVTEEQPA